MSLGSTIKKTIKHWVYGPQQTNAATGYNTWAETYDEQNDNLLVMLDEKLFTNLLDKTVMENKAVVDIGCGTGRHWKKIFDRHPKSLTGFDVSVEMLNRLKQKYPHGNVHLLKDDKLSELANASCDVIVSTLVIGYIKQLHLAFEAWNRILKKEGEIVITDFHPAALQSGASRSFRHNGKVIDIKNYIHSLDDIRLLAGKWKWNELTIQEIKVDEQVKPFYESHNRLAAYENAYGTPLIYDLHFKKNYTN